METTSRAYGVAAGLRKTFGLAYAQTLIGLRNLYPLISVGLIPGALYLMFFLVGGQELSQHVLYGALTAQALGAGLVSMPQFIVIHRDRRLLDMYIASPMGPLSYMFGFAGGRLIYMLPGMVILFSILLGFGFMQLHNLPATLLIVLVTFALGSMIGFTIATYTKSLFVTGAVSNILNSLFMMLPPVMYPLAIIPDRYQWLAFLAPTTAVAELIRWVNNLAELTSGRLTLCILLLAAWLLACLAMVLFKSRWREV